MRQMIEITPMTLKRLQNYHQVVDNELKKAHKLQWMEMTLDRMKEYQEVLHRADHVGAAVGYASFLFRVQNGMTPARILYGEQVLRNTLLELMKMLRISVVMIAVTEEEPETANSV
jgi:hypothetical protein